MVCLVSSRGERFAWAEAELVCWMDGVLKPHGVGMAIHTYIGPGL